MMTERETSADIDEAAEAWLARIDAAPLDPDSQAALEAWLAGDIRRLGAFARVQAVWVHARRARALGPGFDPDLYSFVNEPPAVAAAAPTEDEVGGKLDRRRFLTWGASAAIAAGVGITAFGFQSPAQAYRTGRGEVRLVLLVDGSQMVLNTASAANVKYSRHERRVELADGEALFNVAKIGAQPFTVEVGDTEVCALGTSFTVRRLVGEPIEVLVSRGVVEIRPGQGIEQRLSANMRAVIADGSIVRTTALDSKEVGRELSWREGMLAFEDEPLDDAVKKFARYSDTPIRFAYPEIGRETITGLFAINNPRGFAEAAALTLGLHAEQTRDGILIAGRDIVRDNRKARQSGT